MANVIIYTKPNCPYCVNAKNLLDHKGVKYQEIRVDQDPQQLQEMMDRSKRRTVPQIFINNQSIGGFDDLRALDEAGKLDQILAR